MSSTGCGFLLLTFLALLVGFVPFLAWTNFVMALPLAIISLGIYAGAARKRRTQPADLALFWIALGLAAIVIGRLVIIQL